MPFRLFHGHFNKLLHCPHKAFNDLFDCPHLYKPIPKSPVIRRSWWTKRQILMKSNKNVQHKGSVLIRHWAPFAHLGLHMGAFSTRLPRLRTVELDVKISGWSVRCSLFNGLFLLSYLQLKIPVLIKFTIQVIRRWIVEWTKWEMSDKFFRWTIFFFCLFVPR